MTSSVTEGSQFGKKVSDAVSHKIANKNLDVFDEKHSRRLRNFTKIFISQQGKNIFLCEKFSCSSCGDLSDTRLLNRIDSEADTFSNFEKGRKKVSFFQRKRKNTTGKTVSFKDKMNSNKTAPSVSFS